MYRWVCCLKSIKEHVQQGFQDSYCHLTSCLKSIKEHIQQVLSPPIITHYCCLKFIKNMYNKTMECIARGMRLFKVYKRTCTTSTTIIQLEIKMLFKVYKRAYTTRKIQSSGITYRCLKSIKEHIQQVVLM